MPKMTREEFDDDLDEATWAVLQVFGLSNQAGSDFAAALNDAIKAVIEPHVSVMEVT